jgi:2TM domain
LSLRYQLSGMDPQATEPAKTRAQEAPPRAAALSEARLAAARRRVAALKAFYIHLGVFVLVLAGLLILNSLTGGPWWVVWVFLGWGAGVLAHGLALSARGSRAIAAWEKRKLEAYLAQDDGGSPGSRQDTNRPS